MMAGTRHPWRIRTCFGLMILAAMLIPSQRLLGEDDDASFKNRERNSSQLPREETSRVREPGTKSGGGRPVAELTEEEGDEQRPTGEPLEVEKLPPALENILQTWEQKTSQIKKLKGEFFKHSYDNVFSVQTMAKGEFMYEAPDRGYYMFQGVVAKPRDVKLKKDRMEKPFDFKPDNDEKWYCTGAEIYQINVGLKTYDKIPIPPENRGKNIIDGPLPFLFGMKTEQAKKRYRLELIKSNADAIWIGVKPKLQHDMANYSEATVILNAETFLPNAVRLIDPPGTKETVHLFKNVTTTIINWPLQDPFKPRLLGLKPAVHEEQISEESETIRRPTGGKNAIPRSSSNLTPNGGGTRPRTAIRENPM